MPIEAVFDGRMSWTEAWDLTQELLKDPSSHVTTALADWEYPLSREGLALADLIDITRMVHTDKKRRSRVTPYPRPFPVAESEITRSARPKVDQSTIKRALAKLGH